MNGFGCKNNLLSEGEEGQGQNNLCSAIGGVSAETVLERERRLSRT